ncbi:MAG: TonB-dependent receptor, partial [Campylobacteraceae bacterium]|nr:TonB-dependent receptor [Campylobacteraceae bacterium]MBT6388199.1 TonB-dependent receptor [Campylobacteraceae bacterium]MBT6578613.1 TonB-dependent receptor [Campylobacteraceae bacterium]MBT7273458.1 TonB-dependent receptor [Campylobacteraceae bacterium]
ALDISQEEITLDPIVVSSDFREKSLSETSNAITVLSDDEISDKASQSFIETISSVPNVNFSSGASKAKYIQIRGIGERSQFETPMNPSVAIIQDGIDFSHATLGLGMFDVQQVEILRGPQGTVFGANALAGVVVVESNKPTKHTEGHIETTIGNYNTKAIGAAVGGTLIENKLLGRFSIYKNTSDGFITNSYLNRDDTNNINELTTKTKLSWLVKDNHTIDFNILHANIKNGYDAFNFDNSRTTISDEPGKDTQKTDALSIKSTYDFTKTKLISTISTSKSNTQYMYDEDWSYPTFDPSAWTGTDEFLRNNKQTDIDLRLLSNQDARIFNDLSDWTIGAYYKNYEDNLIRNHSWNAQYTSKYKTNNKAIYGQIDTHISDNTTIISGLRVEEIDSNFKDSSNFNTHTQETLVGGKIGINHKISKTNMYYISLSKGYKPGGVNATNAIPNSERTFNTETLWNIDLGTNKSYFENTLITRLNLFYGKRIDQQVKSSFVTNPLSSNTTFDEYYNNAAKAHNYGLETQIDYFINDDISLYTSIGLLRSKFDEYIDANPSSLDVSGRTPAQSPSYQYKTEINYMITKNWNLKTDIEGKGSFYFSNRHNEKANSYKLLNSSITYIEDALTVTLWGKNLTNEKYQTRGFGTFGNNPANDWVTELYTQQGNPRTFGFTLGYDF